jgi:uncharacterized membrane protein required for colicin V production
LISIAIILVLAYFYYSGERRGAALQWLHVGGYALSFLAATALAQPLGEHFTLLIPYPSATNAGQFAFYSDKIGLTLDTAFYRGFAFLLVLTIGWLMTRIISLWFHDLTYKAMGHRRSAVIGGIANLVIGYIFLFLILALLALIPIAGIQQGLDHSIVAKVMIKYSPGLTQFVNALWL